MSRKRRTKIEWFKAYIAFMVFIISVSAVDSWLCVLPMATALLSLIYLKIVATRLHQRGEF
jgi:hypothetical protein